MKSAVSLDFQLVRPLLSVLRTIAGKVRDDCDCQFKRWKFGDG